MSQHDELCDDLVQILECDFESIEVKKFALLHESIHVVRLEFFFNGYYNCLTICKLEGYMIRAWIFGANIDGPPNFEIDLRYTDLATLLTHADYLFEQPSSFVIKFFHKNIFKHCPWYEYYNTVRFTSKLSAESHSLFTKIFTAAFTLRQWHQHIISNNNRRSDRYCRGHYYDGYGFHMLAHTEFMPDPEESDIHEVEYL